MCWIGVMAGDTQSPSSKKSRQGAKLFALVLVSAIAPRECVDMATARRPTGKRPTDENRPTRRNIRPTQLQWRGLKLAPVTMMTFRPEQVTEGTIAVDDDLTTPVFSHYSGRVIR